MPGMRGAIASRLAVCAGVAIVIAVAMAAVFEVGGYSADAVLTDVAATAELPWWYGAGTAVGVFMWAAMSACCLLAGWTLLGLGAPAEGRYLVVTGVLLGGLSFDDALELHEAAFLKTGLSQPQIYAVYGLIALAWAWRFRARLLASDRVLLAASVGALSVSVLLDVGDSGVVVEEFFKLLGISLGLVYWAAECRRALLGRLPDGREADLGRG
jgi:hypothetical protein